MTEFSSVAIAYGDGIGPEVMEAALVLLREVEAPLRIQTIEIGKRIFAMQTPNGVLPGAFSTLQQSQALLKAPCQNNGIIVSNIKEHFNITESTYSEFLTWPQAPKAVMHHNANFAIIEPEQAFDASKPGKNKADPLPMFAAAIVLLEYLHLSDYAERLRAAIDTALAQGLRPASHYQRGVGQTKFRNLEFAEAVAALL